jgi:hypothetical protein
VKYEPHAPPGAPFETSFIVSLLARTFRAMIEQARPFHPMLLDASDVEAPPSLVPFLDTWSADDRADALFACVACWPLRPVRCVLFASDTFVRFFTDDEPRQGRGSVAPSDDPRALDALALIYAERDASGVTLWQSVYPYALDDDGSFAWRANPRDESWRQVDGTLSRMHVAVLGGLFSDDELAAEHLRSRSS